MSFTTVMVIVVGMCIGMIGLVIGYIKGGYSYKHTIDELPEQKASHDKK